MMLNSMLNMSGSPDIRSVLRLTLRLVDGMARRMTILLILQVLFCHFHVTCSSEGIQNNVGS